MKEVNGNVRVRRPAYGKPLKDYEPCPSCGTSKYMNYTGQIQRGMRMYSCARCKLIVLSWGPKIRKPRLPRDMNGRVFRLTDEMGEGT
jgi:hypothetical protein